MPKTLKTTAFPGPTARSQVQGGGLLPPRLDDGLKTRSSEVFGL